MNNTRRTIPAIMNMSVTFMGMRSAYREAVGHV